MAETVMLHVRVDERINDNAATALEAMGLTLSEAVRVFLTRVAAEQAFPFAIKVPNAETRAAMEEARGMVKTEARFGRAEELFGALDAGDP
jgi:DNA-damage-inducible protein J